MDAELKRLLEAAAKGDDKALARLAAVLRRRNHGRPHNDHDRVLELLATERWIDVAALTRFNHTANIAVAAFIRQKIEVWSQDEDAFPILVEERDDVAWILELPDDWRIAVRQDDIPWIEWVRTDDGVILFKQTSPRIHIFESRRDPVVLWLLEVEGERSLLNPVRQVAEALRAAGALMDGVARARSAGDAVRSAESFVERLIDIGRRRDGE